MLIMTMTILNDENNSYIDDSQNIYNICIRDGRTILQ